MDPVSLLKEKGLSEDKIVEYQAAFHLFDGGGRGVIDASSLGGLLNGTFGSSQRSPQNHGRHRALEPVVVLWVCFFVSWGFQQVKTSVRRI